MVFSGLEATSELPTLFATLENVERLHDIDRVVLFASLRTPTEFHFQLLLCIPFEWFEMHRQPSVALEKNNERWKRVLEENARVRKM